MKIDVNETIEDDTDSEEETHISIIKPEETTTEDPEMIFELKPTWANKASRKINSKDEINKIKTKVNANKPIKNTKNIEED